MKKQKTQNQKQITFLELLFEEFHQFWLRELREIALGEVHCSVNLHKKPFSNKHVICLMFKVMKSKSSQTHPKIIPKAFKITYPINIPKSFKSHPGNIRNSARSAKKMYCRNVVFRLIGYDYYCLRNLGNTILAKYSKLVVSSILSSLAKVIKV